GDADEADDSIVAFQRHDKPAAPATRASDILAAVVRLGISHDIDDLRYLTAENSFDVPHARDWHGKRRAEHRGGFRADRGGPDQFDHVTRESEHRGRMTGHQFFRTLGDGVEHRL